MTLRKANDVWNNVEDQRLKTDLDTKAWRRSYKGVCAAIESLNLVVITSEDEFGSLDIPITRDGHPHYDRRKIIVTRNDVISKPTRIDGILTGKSGLLTDVERETINVIRSKNRSTVLPKGIAANNNREHDTIRELHHLLGLKEKLHHCFLEEHRLGDIAYSLNGKKWVGDQVKSAKVISGGQCIYNHSSGVVKVKHILKYLENDLSITFVGKNRNDNIAVVWFFTVESIPMLNAFRSDQYFTPRLYLTRKSFNQFTLAYNHPDIRFDIQKVPADTERLLQAKISYVESGVKHTLEFLNENASHITSPSLRIEFQSYQITRNACRQLGIQIIRHIDDHYGKIDFRVGKCRVQDKVANAVFNMRRQGGHPFDPDKIDIFQVSDIHNRIVYSIPMRVEKDYKILSFFSGDILMKNTIRFIDSWKKRHEKFLCDLNTHNGIEKYLDICKQAADLPSLSDGKFHANLIADNLDKFGTLRSYRKKIIPSC